MENKIRITSLILLGIITGNFLIWTMPYVFSAEIMASMNPLLSLFLANVLSPSIFIVMFLTKYGRFEGKEK